MIGVALHCKISGAPRRRGGARSSPNKGGEKLTCIRSKCAASFIRLRRVLSTN